MNLESLYDYFTTLDTRNFYKIAGVFLVTIVCALSGISYIYITSTEALQEQLVHVYKQHNEAYMLLQRVEKVEQHKQEIDLILEQDKDFRLKNSFDEIVKKLQLTHQQTPEPTIKQQAELDKQYVAVTLAAQFKKITTEQLCNILQALEEIKRIYITELIITKSGDSFIDCTLTIGTLTPQVEKIPT